MWQRMKATDNYKLHFYNPRVKILMIAQQLHVIFCNLLKQVVEKTHFFLYFLASTDSTISFSDIHKNIGLFANNFDNQFPDSSFFQNESPGDQVISISDSSSNQIKKLVEKTRANVRQLGVHLKVLDPSKMLNILVIAQQLNTIDPPPKIVEVATPITVKDILTVPTTARTKKRIRKKLSFGVMSDIEIVSSVEGIIQSEIEEEKQSENDQLMNIERSKDVDLLQVNIQEMQAVVAQKRNALKQLKDARAAEKKEASKRKASVVAGKKARNVKQLKSNPNASEDVNVKPAKRSKKN